MVKLLVNKNYKVFKKNWNFKQLDFDIEEIGKPYLFKWRDCKLKTVSYGHGITTTPIQLAKGYAVIANGGYDVKPTLIKEKLYNLQKKRILNKKVSSQINKMLRKVVTQGTANSF